MIVQRSTLSRGLSSCVVAGLLAGCATPQVPVPAANAMQRVAVRLSPSSTSTPIRHVVVVVQVGRSFDNLFDGYPGADTVKKGMAQRRLVPLKPITLQTSGVPGNGVTLPASPLTFATEYDRAKMDGFDLIHFGANGDGPPAHLYPYAYVVRSETKPYWNLAAQYALADHMYATEDAPSFVGSEVLIAGSTQLHPPSPRKYVVGVTNAGGCDAPRGTRTLLSDGSWKIERGPRPCFSWETMAGLLDAAKVSWKYYTLLCSGRDADAGCLWNAFETIEAVRHGVEWARNVSVPNSNFFSDLEKGKLPAVSWITPTLAESDDSASGSKDGPRWVTSIVDAVKGSRYWSDTAVVVIWTDWGGYYDNVPPPSLDRIGLSMRVPLLVVSPYAKAGDVSHTEYEQASILKFIEENWSLGSLGSTDRRATSIRDMFDFTK